MERMGEIRPPCKQPFLFKGKKQEIHLATVGGVIWTKRQRKSRQSLSTDCLDHGCTVGPPWWEGDSSAPTDHMAAALAGS